MAMTTAGVKTGIFYKFIVSRNLLWTVEFVNNLQKFVVDCGVS